MFVTETPDVIERKALTNEFAKSVTDRLRFRDYFSFQLRIRVFWGLRRRIRGNS
jgi:hypothetical protein